MILVASILVSSVFSTVFASVFTVKDVVQFVGLGISLGGVVWFLAGRLSAIESTLNVLKERQANWIERNERIENKVDKNVDAIAEIRERLVKLENSSK